MSGVLNVDTIADNAGTGPVTLTKQKAAKQHSTYNTSGTVSTSLNTSSITDQGVGSFDSNYTNNMNTATEAWSGNIWGTSSVRTVTIRTATTSYHRVNSYTMEYAASDKDQTTFVVGDLA